MDKNVHRKMERKIKREKEREKNVVEITVFCLGSELGYSF